jgi:hypothetical protein
MSIGANLIGGSISIGSTTGTTNISGGTAINIGTHTTQTGNIAIGTNNAVLSGTNQIFIGASNKSTNISGAVNINTSGTGNTTIGNASSTTTISSDITNIGTNLTATGRVNIATGTNVSGSQVNIGGDSLTQNIIKGLSVLINSQTGYNTYIGADGGGTTTIRGTTNIGSYATTTNMYGNTFIYSGSQYPLRVISISNYGARFEPQSAQNAKGNIQIHGCFPSLPGDTAPRRVCDIYGGFTGNSWGAEYMALGVGYNSVTNDVSNPTIEKIRIQSDTTIFYTPLTPSYSYPVGSGRIGEIVSGTLTGGLVGDGVIAAIVYVSTSGVWHFSWNIQFVLVGNSTYLRPDFRIPGVTSFNVQCAPMIGQGGYFLMSGSYTSYVTSGTNGYGAIYMNYTFVGWNPYDMYGNLRAVRIA